MQQQAQSQFIPFTPIIDLGFWTTFAKKKIEEYKLDDDPKPIITKFKVNNYKEKFSHLAFDIYSFQLNEANKTGPLEHYVETQLINYNTVENFNNVDTKLFLCKVYHVYEEQKGKELIEGWKEGNNKIVKAFILMFADLKKYLFRYSSQIYSSYKVLVPQLQLSGLNGVVQTPLALNETEQKTLTDSIKQHIHNQTKTESLSQPFYFVDRNTYKELTVKEIKDNQNTLVIYFDAYNQQQLNGNFFNLLYYLKHQGLEKSQIYVIKEYLTYGNQKLNFEKSYICDVDLKAIEVEVDQNKNPQIFEIEHYMKQKEIDLKGFMDERYLARDAVDLNIKLMKWRMLPHIDLELIKSTKCLLFGAGTLGCQLARNLIGWGIRHISFVDYGKISYSNPVRQTLFDFEDSCGGGKSKAEVAAEKLKKIFPDIESAGYQVEIPMPGHYVGEHQAEQTIQSINLLDKLVEEHDAIFLLTDSREARWFPTVLANKHKKICFAVALGFDSFIIIRHGISVLSYDPEKHGDRLSCYYCNDISAPQDSTKDRTLDQQCTVTRPGLSFLAAAYTSELLVSLIQHPLRDGTPASDEVEKLQTTDLGLLPHFLRGQLSDFDVKIFYGRAYNNCVACSQAIVDQYLKDGEKFILRVLNDPEYLQEVSGINASLTQTTMISHEVEVFDDFALIS